MKGRKETKPIQEKQLGCRQTYWNYRLRESQRHIAWFIVLAALINLGMIISDWRMTHYPYYVLIIRFLYSGLMIGSIPFFRKTSSYQYFSWGISLLEIMAVGLVIGVLLVYRQPNVLIQSMGFAVIEAIIFLVPNYWWHRLLIAWFGLVAFFLAVIFGLPVVSWQVVLPAIVFDGILTLIFSATSWYQERYNRFEFEAKVELERLSLTDYLTKISSRGNFYKEAERWLAICRKNNLPLSLIFIDVDRMKVINDDYGHEAGDRALLLVADCIKQRIGKMDVFARWGGDEFVLLLPKREEQSAIQLVNQLRQMVVGQCLFDNYSLTCSFGVAQLKPEQGVNDLIAEADLAMYQDKKIRKESKKTI